MYSKLKEFVDLNVEHIKLSDFKSTLEIAGVDKKLQTEKCLKFFKAAFKSLNTHFMRWVKRDLLPAALMSELPLAKIVARIIVQKPPLHVAHMNNCNSPGYIWPFKSEVHGEKVVDCYFEKWLREMTHKEFMHKQPSHLFPPQVIEGALCVLAAYKNEMMRAQNNMTG